MVQSEIELETKMEKTKCLPTWGVFTQTIGLKMLPSLKSCMGQPDTAGWFYQGKLVAFKYETACCQCKIEDEEEVTEKEEDE